MKNDWEMRKLENEEIRKLENEEISKLENERSNFLEHQLCQSLKLWQSVCRKK